MTPIESQSYEAQVAYTEKNLKSLGQSLLKASKDNAFRKAVYKGVEEKFDDNYNVLIEVLANRKIEGGDDARARVLSYGTEEDVFDDALNAFLNIDSTNYYPQIFIPYYEELGINSIESNSRVAFAESEPTIVIYSGDETQTVYTGYQLNAAGDLEEIDTPVDEVYAQNNETWVLSLNESTTSECQMAQLIDNPGARLTPSSCGGGGGGSTGGGGGSNNIADQDAFIKKIKIKCHKESWVAGASEVHIISIFTDGTNNWPNTGSRVELYGGGDHEGGMLYKVRRKDVRRENWKTTDFNILNNWATVYPNFLYSSIVIFEYDVFPTGRKTVDWGYGLKFRYRSADSYYDEITIFQQGIDFQQRSNSCIEWLGEYK